MAGIFQTLVAASFCWFLASSLWIYPHSLSYFNESIGGPKNGGAHLVNSNIDWGQDLEYFDAWQQRQPEDTPASLHFFGICADCRGYPDTSQLRTQWNNRSEAEHGADRRIDVVSVTLLQGLPWVALDRRGMPTHLSSAELAIAKETCGKMPLTYSLSLLIQQ